LRRSMRELANGKDVDPIEFRDADFWPEVAQEFNAVRARMLVTAAFSKVGGEEEKELSIFG
jgi:hypothetical protein